MISHKKSTIRAVAWTALVRGINQPISILVGIALARLLSPEEFGLVAIALIFTGLAGLLTDFGFGASLIQKETVSEKDRSTIFWVNFALSGAIFISVYFLAENISDFFEQSNLTDILPFLALAFLATPFRMVASTIPAREMNFRPQAISEICGLFAASTVSIILAVKGFGYWALVSQSLLQHYVASITMIIIVRWRPKFQFSINTLREFWHFSSGVFGNNLLNYSANQLDKILIGKGFGAFDLGIYDRAYSTILFPITNVSSLLVQVLFPSLSRIQGDTPKVVRYFSNAMGSIALITFPMMLGLFVVSESFVDFVFGNQWLAVVPILKAFSFIGAIYSITVTTGSVFYAIGKSQKYLKVNLCTKSIRVVSLLIGLPYGIIGVTYGLLAAASINGLIMLKLLGLELHVSMKQLLRPLLSTIVPSIGMFTTTLFFQNFLSSEISSGLELGVLILLGMISYYILLKVFKPEAYLTTRNTLLEDLAPKKLKPLLSWI